MGNVLAVLAARLARGGAGLGRHSSFFVMRSSLHPELCGGASCCLLGLLLTGHGALGALASTRVGLGALAVHRQVTAVAQALVAADLDLAADVRLDLTTQVTLNLVAAVDVGAELDQLLLGEVLDAGCRG